jgi:hypothetical protein
MMRAQGFLYECDPGPSLAHPVEQKWFVATDADDLGMYWSIEMEVTPNGRLITERASSRGWYSAYDCDEHLIGLSEHYQHLGWTWVWQGQTAVPSYDEFCRHGTVTVDSWMSAILFTFASLKARPAVTSLELRPMFRPIFSAIRGRHV